MKQAIGLIASVLVTLVVAHGQGITASAPLSSPKSQPASAKSVRFSAINVYVDSGDQSLAAYQLELSAVRGQISIVGVEGGEHAAFREPPYYDPAAMMNHRVILAAFSTGENLPKGKSRVALVHVQTSGDAEPEFAVELKVAANSEAHRITATASVQ